MLVLFPVPEMWNSGRETGGRGGAQMEVPAQQSDDEARRMSGKAGMGLARGRSDCPLPIIIVEATGERRGVLICSGCYNKVPQTYKQQTFTYPSSGGWKPEIRVLAVFSSCILMAKRVS